MTIESGHSVQRDVEEFHRELGLFMGDRPNLRRTDITASLIAEEARETLEAITGRQVAITYGPASDRGPNLVNSIDGLCDLLATIYGAAVTFGIDLAPFWAEVHRSNLAKKGGRQRADGKQLKPPGWRGPRLEPILAEQRRQAAISPEVAEINARARARADVHRQASLGRVA